MATLKTVTFDGGNGSHFQLRLDYDVLSQDTANMKSVVKYTLKMISKDGYSGYGASATGKINQTSVGTISSIGVNKTVVIGTKQETIKHNDDGTKTVSYSASLSTNWTGLGSASISGTYSLPTIRNLAYITSANDFNDTENPIITFSNPNGYDVYPYLNFYDDDISTTEPIYSIRRTPVEGATTPIDSPYQWEITNEERNALTLACNTKNQYRVRIGVDSYKSGGTTSDDKLGYNGVSKNFNIINADPNPSATSTELNTKVANIMSSNSLINNASKLKITVTPNLQKNATLSEISITSPTETQTLTSEATSPYELTFSINDYSIGSCSFSIKVTDSRNNSTTIEISKVVTRYYALVIKSLSFTRDDSTGSNLILNCTCVGTTGTFNGHLQSFSLKWRTEDEQNWHTLSSPSYSDYDLYRDYIKITNRTLTNVVPYNQRKRLYFKIEDLFTEAQLGFLVSEGCGTFDVGETDVNINGDLYVSDKTAQNQVNLTPFRLNDTYEFRTRLDIGGLLTTERSSVFATIYLPRPFDDSVIPVFTYGTFKLRGVNGYLENNSESSSTYSYNNSNPAIIINSAYDNQIELKIWKHSGSTNQAFTGSTNNTPVGIAIENLKIRFDARS